MSIVIRYRRLTREFFAEFLGTFILITMALTAIAQRVLGSEGAGSQATVSWATGIGVTMGVYVSGGVSGGHINPAVTVAMAVLGRLPWFKVPVYIAGQLLGSFVASAAVYLVYMEALDHYDGGVRQVFGEKGTGAIWATYPQPYVSTWSGLGDQVFSTAFLLICILAISDRRNMRPHPGLVPISLGLIVVATNMTLALNCGNAMNPARDLSPRLFTTLAGWGSEPFRNYNWWWVPVLGPHLGALLGAAAYQGIVGHHLAVSGAGRTEAESNSDVQSQSLLLVPPEIVVTREDDNPRHRPAKKQKKTEKKYNKSLR